MDSFLQSFYELFDASNTENSQISQHSVSSTANTGRQNSLGAALNWFSCKLGLVDQTT